MSSNAEPESEFPSHPTWDENYSPLLVAITEWRLALLLTSIRYFTDQVISHQARVVSSGSAKPSNECKVKFQP